MKRITLIILMVSIVTFCFAENEIFEGKVKVPANGVYTYTFKMEEYEYLKVDFEVKGDEPVDVFLFDEGSYNKRSTAKSSVYIFTFFQLFDYSQASFTFAVFKEPKYVLVFKNRSQKGKIVNFKISEISSPAPGLFIYDLFSLGQSVTGLIFYEAEFFYKENTTLEYMVLYEKDFPINLKIVPETGNFDLEKYTIKEFNFGEEPELVLLKSQKSLKKFDGEIRAEGEYENILLKVYSDADKKMKITAGIANPEYYITAGKFDDCKSNLRNLGIAVECYAIDHEGYYPERLEELETDGYIGRIPKCSEKGKSYIYKNEGTKFTISCPNPEKHFYKPGKRCSQVYYEGERGIVVLDKNGNKIN